MKIKNALLMSVSFILVAAIAIGGTVAYLTSEDSDVNVMTLGNVKIEQIEQERNENGALVDFTQAKPLYPYVGEVAWNDAKTNISGHEYNMFGEKLKNSRDKIVTVKNTGKSDAYVRTWIALEDPFTTSLLGVNVGGVGYTQSPWTTATIDGVQYSATCFTYDAALKPGEVSLPSLLQVYLKYTATNEDVALLGDTFEILAFSQAVQTNGFADAKTALDTAFGTNHPWADGVKLPTIVSTAAELQAAIDAAVDGDTIILGDDIEGDVTVTQKPGVKFTINGNGKTLAGVLLVDGKSGTYTTAGLTIKNLTFKAESISADACIRLGNGTNDTRYTCNVTVESCTFDVPGAVGVKSYTGGDKNLTITGCTATANAHSLVQAKGIDSVLVENCKVYSKNGLNFNNSDNVTVVGCTVDVKGYAVRFGESSGGVGAAETYLIKDCALKSANDEGDATIILRGTADYSTLTIVNTTIVGNPDITNTATGTTVVK